MTLATIQTAILDLLQGPTLATLAESGVVCLAENKGDIIAAVDTAIAQAGICATVITPQFTSESEASHRIVGTTEAIVQIFETPSLNRTRANSITALDAAELIATRLNLTQAHCGTLVFRRLDTATVSPDTILYNVHFTLKTTLG